MTVDVYYGHIIMKIIIKAASTDDRAPTPVCTSGYAMAEVSDWMPILYIMRRARCENLI